MGGSAAEAGARDGADPGAAGRWPGAVAALALGVHVDAGRIGLLRGACDDGRAPAVRRRRGLRAGARRPGAAGADVGPEPAARARGLPGGERSRGGHGAGWRGRAVRGAGALEARAGGLRTGDVHQLLGRGDHQAAAGADARAGGAGRPRQRGGAQARARRRALRGRGEAARPAGRAARVRAVREGAARAQRQVRAQPDGRAEGQRPGLRLPARVRSRAGRAGAEGEVRVPVPVGGLGADLGAAEGGAERCAARASRRADPVRGGDERVRARRRRQLRRHRRAGARGRDHGRPGGVDACGCCWSRWR